MQFSVRTTELPGLWSCTLPRMVSLADRLSLLQLAAPAASVTAVDDSSGEHIARARLDFINTTAVRYAYLDAPDPKGLPLRLYPADTLEQARIFYRSAARVQRTLALRDHGGQLAPIFHFGFMSRGLCWSRSSLATDDYARYWVERIDETRAINRDEWPRWVLGRPISAQHAAKRSAD
jgi:hypothetical protein